MADSVAEKCSATACERPIEIKSRGWCRKHYARWRSHGDPDYTERPTWGVPIEERFWAKVDATGDCWEWVAHRTYQGYGTFRGSDGQMVGAHRQAWEFLVGPIPDGLTLDHLCRNRACVNPDHLEPVDWATNKRRGYGLPKLMGLRTHCPRGHPYSGENLRLYTPPGKSTPRRYCRTCQARSRRKATAT